MLGVASPDLSDDSAAAADSTEESKPSFKVIEGRDTATIWSFGSAVRTADDAIAKAQFDMAIWYVVNQEATAWSTPMKLKSGSRKDGTYEEKPHTSHSWRVHVKLARLAPKPIQDGIADLLKDLQIDKLPSIRRRKTVREHLLEISLYDAHFAKLCWAAEVGHDYDLAICESDFINAGDDLLERTAHLSIEQITLPIGHDFFHVDNWLGTTARGTVVESSDDRFTKVFRHGSRAVRHLIMKLREVAPVRVIWVPGNHDPATSWYMTEYLAAVFEKDRHVVVDNQGGARPFRYHRHGDVLLGYYHGQTIKPDKLALMMATDERRAWGEAIHCAWRTGHRHKRMTVQFVTPTDTFMGVRIDTLPSISGTDFWHLENGFVNNPRTAEAWEWSRECGYVGHQTVATRSQRAEWKESRKDSRNG